MLHVGYPVTFETAQSLFPWAENMDSDDFEKVLAKFNIGLFGVDKGLCILGIQVPELSDLWEKFVHVDKALALIVKTNNKLITLLKKAKANLSEFDIQEMEGEPQRVRNPKPYVISV